MRAQPGDVRLHQLGRARDHEREHADSLGEVDDRLGLPAQQAAIEVRLVEILGHMAEIHEVRGLGVHDSMEVRAGAGDRIVVDPEVRVPFAGD